MNTNPVLSDDEILALINEPASNVVPLPHQEKAAVKTFNFGKVKVKTKEETKSVFPVLPDATGEIKEIADAWLAAHAQEEAAKGAKEMYAAQIKERALPFHYTVNAGLADPPNTVSVAGSEGEVLVQYKDAYTKLDDLTPIEQAIGPAAAAKFIEQRFEYTVKSELIPDNKVQEVIQKMNELSELIGVDGAVNVKPFFKPTKQFKTARYRELTTEQNIALDKIGEKGFTIVAVTSAKGRKRS